MIGFAGMGNAFAVALRGINAPGKITIRKDINQNSGPAAPNLKTERQIKLVFN